MKINEDIFNIKNSSLWLLLTLGNLFIGNETHESLWKRSFGLMIKNYTVLMIAKPKVKYLEVLKIGTSHIIQKVLKLNPKN